MATGFQLGEEGEKWVGVDVEEGLARRMARGDVNPETGLEIVDEWPEFAGGSGGAGVAGEGAGVGGAVSSLGGKRQAKAHAVHGVHVQGPMDAFITSRFHIQFSSLRLLGVGICVYKG